MTFEPITPVINVAQPHLKNSDQNNLNIFLFYPRSVVRDNAWNTCPGQRQMTTRKDVEERAQHEERARHVQRAPIVRKAHHDLEVNLPKRNDE